MLEVAIQYASRVDCHLLYYALHEKQQQVEPEVRLILLVAHVVVAVGSKHPKSKVIDTDKRTRLAPNRESSTSTKNFFHENKNYKLLITVKLKYLAKTDLSRNRNAV